MIFCFFFNIFILFNLIILFKLLYNFENIKIFILNKTFDVCVKYLIIGERRFALCKQKLATQLAPTLIIWLRLFANPLIHGRFLWTKHGKADNAHYATLYKIHAAPQCNIRRADHN